MIVILAAACLARGGRHGPGAVAVAVIRERAYLIWIGLAVVVAISFAAYR